METSSPQTSRPKAAPSWQPLAFAIVLILGVWIGLLSGGESAGTFAPGSPRSALNGVLDRVEQTYVDPVMRDELEQIALEAVLNELFRNVAEIGGTSAFKVFQAAQPRRL